MIARLRQHIRRGAGQWLRNLSGTASVEFAIALPVMAALLLGGFAVTSMVLTYRKLCDTTTQLADMVSQLGASGDPDILEKDLQNSMSAVTSVMYPASTTGLTITVGLVDFNAANTPIQGSAPTAPTTMWIYQLNGSTLTKVVSPAPTASETNALSVASLPPTSGCTGTTVPCYSYFWVQTAYTFQPAFGGQYIGLSIPMTSQVFIQPRNVNVIYCTTDGTTPC